MDFSNFRNNLDVVYKDGINSRIKDEHIKQIKTIARGKNENVVSKENIEEISR